MAGLTVGCALLATPNVATSQHGDPDDPVVVLQYSQPPAAAAVQQHWQRLAERLAIDHDPARRNCNAFVSSTAEDVTIPRLRQLLVDLREDIAGFDDTGTEERLRQVESVYHCAERPSSELFELVAAAWHEVIALALASGDRQHAQSLSSRVRQRFPNSDLDRSRHGPVVQEFFDTAPPRTNSAMTYTVNLAAPKGELWLDGDRIQVVASSVSVTVREPTARLWWVDDEGIPRGVLSLHTADDDTTIDWTQSWRTIFSLYPQPHLSCVERCDSHLLDIARSFQWRNVSVYSAAHLDKEPPTVEAVYFVRDARGVNPFAAAHATEPLGRPQWMSFAPLGIGQFAQGRYLVGSAWLAADATLVTWNVVTALSYDEDASLEDRAMTQSEQNLSAGLLVAAIALGVLEAVLYDVFFGEVSESTSDMSHSSVNAPRAVAESAEN